MSRHTINTLLIANRGEIACRIIRTARRLGIRTVAVYSQADENALHVRMADQALPIGPAEAAQSYLNIEAIVAAAQRAGADAIHPGYGFLSENAKFARAVEAAGLIFVGPGAEAIEVMGDKARAKRAMIAAGVPCLPGYEGKDQSDAALTKAAEEIGFPLMVKAAAGGGGRGMRRVPQAEDLAHALAAARSEAKNAFGDETLILEKAIASPRHVEIQVFADAHGTAVHMGERDCSLQRRHQKVVEEAPCPVLTPETRTAMGEAAVAAAQAVEYRGAGTVEFLLDSDGAFYFLEMNTRLQVEHPVTEMVTGLDLVALQLQVAGGAPLGLTQSDIALSGHAIEVRLYAEDPDQDFLPAAGRVHAFSPAAGESVRVDAGLDGPGEISAHYDPMVAKLIAWGETREVARRRLLRALEETVLFGPKTNQAFLHRAISHPRFAQGQVTTDFLETAGDEVKDTPQAEDIDLAAVCEHILRRDEARTAALSVPEELLDWSSSMPRASTVTFAGADGPRTLHVLPQGGHRYTIQDGEALRGLTARRTADDRIEVTSERRLHHLRVLRLADGTLYLQDGARTLMVENEAIRLRPAGAGHGGGAVLAPMHGRLVELFVAPGETVVKDQRLGVLEAMKMHHELRALIDGTITEIAAEVGAQIAADALILTIEPAHKNKESGHAAG